MSKAIRIYQTGGPEVLKLEDVTGGEPAAGQARVRHTAIGVNFIDTYHRTGLYRIPLPAILGREAAGIVEAVGDGVSGFAAGDRVVSQAGSGGEQQPMALHTGPDSLDALKGSFLEPYLPATSGGSRAIAAADLA